MRALSFTSLALLFTILSVQAHAQTATPATIRDTVRQQVETELTQIRSTVTKKAYVGPITAKNDGSITISNHLTQSRTALVTTTATIRLANGRDGTPADLKVNDYVIAMGDADGAGSLTVKRLLVTTKPPADTRKIVYGTVSTVSASSITLKSGDSDVTARLQSATKYTGTTKPADVKTDSKVVLVTTGTATLTATHLHLFP